MENLQRLKLFPFCTNLSDYNIIKQKSPNLTMYLIVHHLSNISSTFKSNHEIYYDLLKFIWNEDSTFKNKHCLQKKHVCINIFLFYFCAHQYNLINFAIDVLCFS